MNVENRDLLAACIWAAATAAVMALGDSTLLRTVMGLPMVVIVPGHVLLRAIGMRTASLPEHLVYAVGTSLAVGIGGGFVLNAVGTLTPTGWAAWFMAVVAVASLVAVRRGDAPDLPAWQWPTGFGLRHLTAFALAASVATGAYALAVRDEAKQQQFKYTALWLLPDAGGGGLAVGIRSGEAALHQFDLEISVDGRPFAAFRSLTVAPGETWTRELPVPSVAAPQKAEARLYRLEDDRLYRHVSALVPGT
jgi:hypothetical protein